MLQKKRIRNHILQTFNHHLLHSDKSTYFYNNKHSDDNNKKQRYKLSYSHSWQTIPLVCSSFALLGLGIGLVNPSIGGVGIGSSNGSAYAAPITEELNKYSSIAFSITKDDGTEIANNGTVSTEATTGLVNYITTKINLTAKKINRFYVGVQAVGGDGNLTGTVNKATIAPVTANTKPANFADNTWGYSLVDNTTASSELEYSPLPAYNTSTPLQYTSNTNLADGDYTLKLTFAAKINANKPADHYTTSTLVSVLADAKQLTLLDIDEMQDMTSDICSATPAPTAEDVKNKTHDEIIAATPNKQLKDSRDGKYYWVSKLADGNCWMTQNLDFDIPEKLNTDGVITSDINIADFATDTIKVDKPGDWPANGDNYKYNGYYDPGDYIYNGPSNNPHGRGTSCSTTTGLSECASKYSKEWAATTSNTNALGDADTHYHIGNYYSFSAATVKSADSTTTQGIPTPNSICPKGWQLPTSEPGGVTGHFFDMLDRYGVRHSLTNGDYAIYKEPFYFIYGGLLNFGALNNLGYDGHYWSSSITGTMAINVWFDNSSVTIAGYTARYHGVSVRCVAR